MQDLHRQLQSRVDRLLRISLVGFALWLDYGARISF
jgi:hypothetical protein